MVPARERDRVPTGSSSPHRIGVVQTRLPIVPLQNGCSPKKPQRPAGVGVPVPTSPRRKVSAGMEVRETTTPLGGSPTVPSPMRASPRQSPDASPTQDADVGGCPASLLTVGAREHTQASAGGDTIYSTQWTTAPDSPQLHEASPASAAGPRTPARPRSEAHSTLGMLSGLDAQPAVSEQSPPASPARQSSDEHEADRPSRPASSLSGPRGLTKEQRMPSERLQLQQMMSRRETIAALAEGPPTEGQPSSVPSPPFAPFTPVQQQLNSGQAETVMSPIAAHQNRKRRTSRAGPLDLDETPTLTTNQVVQYHSILDGLSRIDGMHAAVGHPSGNLFWDFSTKRCLPGRVWKDKAPDHVKEKIARDFTESESTAAAAAIRLDTAPSVPDPIHPRALILIGPAAAGKSMILHKVEDIMGLDLGTYVEIDGDELRLCHGGWTEVLSDLTTGYKDAYDYLKPFSKKLKVNFLRRAMKGRKNLLLPTTGSQPKKLVDEYRMLKKAGYKVDMIGLIVSYKEARARGLNRAHENGRHFGDASHTKWEDAMRAIKYLSHPARTDWCIVFDNEDFNNPQPIYTRTHNPDFIDIVVEQYRKRDGIDTPPSTPQGIFAVGDPIPSDSGICAHCGASTSRSRSPS
eukprot:TRINITY_DN4575_c0_g1_i1.p1 TRINITY_DN4575_c0_g1~~TRINITY_DN4575_c0_g1_i1.p1  ORF type:complete len:711 (+),score=164.74 TRINITY_DN4575_c0_g1_i1:238-2133(+)